MASWTPQTTVEDLRALDLELSKTLPFSANYAGLRAARRLFVENLAAQSAKPLTVDDVEAGLDNPEWGGYGYLAERSRARRAVQDRGDAFLLREANARGWAPARLFEFTNSGMGRHFGDLVFGGWSDAEVERDIASYFARFERGAQFGQR